MKKILQVVAVVFSGAAAVIWAVRAAVDIVCGVYEISGPLVALDAFCAVIWAAAFFIQLYRLRADRERE